MTSFFRSSILAVAVASTAMTATSAFADEKSPPAVMSISATGVATATPDEAIIVLGVENTGFNARDAMGENTEAMTAIFTALADLGIDQDDISTSGLSLNPSYDYTKNQEPRITGYRVANQVTVTVDDIDGLGAVLDRLVGAGANQIRSVSFGVSDTSAMEHEARTKAAAAVRAKAQTYADAMGTEIRAIISISEAGNSVRPYAPAMMMRSETMMSDSAVPISASDVDVSVTLNVAFELSGNIN